MLPFDERLLTWLPHRPPMLLLGEVLAVSAGSATSRIEISEESSFYVPALKGVPSSVGLEYMGQTAALCHGWEVDQGLADPTLGIFLGSRKFIAKTDRFSLGSLLRVEAGGANYVGSHLVNFSCSIFCDNTDEEMATGTLTVLLQALEKEAQ